MCVCVCTGYILYVCTIVRYACAFVCNCTRKKKGRTIPKRPLYLIIIIISKCNCATRSRVLHNPEYSNYQMAFIKINAATMILFVRAYSFPTISIVNLANVSVHTPHSTHYTIVINVLCVHIIQFFYIAQLNGIWFGVNQVHFMISTEAE